MIKIFGHKSPDTDSTGSPLIWEWYNTNIRKSEASAALLGKTNSEALFVLDRWEFTPPPIIDDVEDGENVIIVDTNNPAELPTNIHSANILEIIDHHLLTGGLSTRNPIAITFKPLACTATIMHDLMEETGRKNMPAGIKGLTLSCILSDTLAFRSPTTTEHDMRLAERLAEDLSIDISDYASEMFAAKSDISSYSNEDLVLLDSKRYDTDDRKLRISVLETTAPDSIFDRKADLLKAMETVAENEKIDQVLFFIVDILRQQSTLLLPNDLSRRIASKSFAVDTADSYVVLPGVVSRKKQIIPNLRA